MNGDGETFAELSTTSNFLPLTLRHFNASGASDSQETRKGARPGMGVIGRLDDQVNEIIIKPVGERRKDEGGEPSIPTEVSRPAPRATDEEDSIQGKGKHHARPRELPVWLL
jgi:hypothetical protein